MLVGTDEDRVLEETTRLLDDEDAYSRIMRVHNPYGDGPICQRIAGILSRSFQLGYPAKAARD